MILTRKNTIGLYHTSATISKSEDNFKLIATNTVTNKSIELIITSEIRTKRYDFYHIDATSFDMEVGYWDYVIVPENWDISYDTVYDIQKRTPRWILERGKWLVTAEDGRVPNMTIINKIDRVTYKGK